jgi:hypothetical protein
MTETKKNSLSRALEAWFSTAILKKDMAWPQSAHYDVIFEERQRRVMTENLEAVTIFVSGTGDLVFSSIRRAALVWTWKPTIVSFDNLGK